MLSVSNCSHLCCCQLSFQCEIVTILLQPIHLHFTISSFQEESTSHYIQISEAAKRHMMLQVYANFRSIYWMERKDTESDHGDVLQEGVNHCWNSEHRAFNLKLTLTLNPAS